MFGTLPSGAGSAGSIPGQRAEIPHNSWSKHPPPQIKTTGQNIVMMNSIRFKKNLEKDFIVFKRTLKTKKRTSEIRSIYNLSLFLMQHICVCVYIYTQIDGGAWWACSPWGR